MSATSSTVIVLGGYGVFGSRIVRSLARHPELEVVIAGRDLLAAQTLKDAVAAPQVRALRVDLSRGPDITVMLASRPTVVVDTVGPFQERDRTLAERCIDAGAHYVDLADDRLHVAGISALNARAKQHELAVISGASTVPAISTALVEDLAPDPNTVIEIEVGISPGHRAPRGLATVRAILSYCGQPIPAVVGEQHTRGWGDLTRHRYPEPVGMRWLSNVDTPERALWRDRYPILRRATIQAGLELGVLHLGLSLLSRGVRLHVLPRLDRWAPPFLQIATALDRWGTDTGAMHVRVVMRDASGRTSTRTATLLAERGDGPQIPATPAALIVKKLLALPGYAPLRERGAMPCVGLITRQEILSELEGLAIRYQVSD